MNFLFEYKREYKLTREIISESHSQAAVETYLSTNKLIENQILQQLGKHNKLIYRQLTKLSEASKSPILETLAEQAIQVIPKVLYSKELNLRKVFSIDHKIANAVKIFANESVEKIERYKQSPCISCITPYVTLKKQKQLVLQLIKKVVPVYLSSLSHLEEQGFGLLKKTSEGDYFFYS